MGITLPRPMGAPCRNRVVRGFRDVEEAAATFDGEVDAATIAFISSNSSASNPDVLLQQRLQDALNAKFAAESRAAALTVRVTLAAS